MTPGRPSFSPLNTRLASGIAAPKQHFAQRDRARKPLGNCAATGRDVFVRVARQNADRNRVFAIDKTARNKFAVAGQNIDDSPGVLGNAAWPQRIAINPRMTCLHT